MAETFFIFFWICAQLFMTYLAILPWPRYSGLHDRMDFMKHPNWDRNMQSLTRLAASMDARS